MLAILLASQNNVAPELAEGLQLLQHRGYASPFLPPPFQLPADYPVLENDSQDACGIVTCGPKGRFYQCKGNGMVRDLLDAKNLSQLIGGMGVGHGEHISFLFARFSQVWDRKLMRDALGVARYPTAGSSAHSESQPFYVNSPYGIVFGHVSFHSVALFRNFSLR